MKRIRIAAILATLLLAGCVSDYAYRGGSGDYYYSRPSYYGYGAPYSSVGYGYPGGWYGSIGYGHGYYPGYGYYGYHRPYYYPYYRPWRPHRPHRPDRPDDDDRPTGPVTGGQRPPMVRPLPPANNPAYTRLPARGGQALRPGRPGQQAGPQYERPRLREGQQPMARPPRGDAPMRAAMPESRPAPVQRMERPAPRMERPAPAPRMERPAPRARVQED